MLTPEIHTHAKYPARIGGSYGSITKYRHQRIKPQILHQKLTYLYQLVYHAFNSKVYSTKYMKEYKAACLKQNMPLIDIMKSRSSTRKPVTKIYTSSSVSTAIL
jgi:hypothetical protein